MASAKVYRMDGSEAGSVELNAAVFDVEINTTMVHDVVVALQAAKRQGNHETKTRDMISGGGKKPYSQKGTGNARHGSTREPQMRGGGTVWGPHKRSYRQSVPLSFRRKALAGVLTDRVRNEQLCVLESLDCKAAKTKPFAEMVRKLSPQGRKTLFVTAGTDKNVLLSARNLERVTLTTASDLNALDVLGAHRVVVLKDALAKLEERLA
ncbi:MAG TPA: 50S ribosomal protein L4 [Candidatus Hydrogenedentes bacterium]|nr:50S ribosomal protein L4 [Candidatus Hydrogenedentota bacterium]